MPASDEPRFQRADNGTGSLDGRRRRPYPNHPIRWVLCTRLTLHSGHVTSRHDMFTPLQCSCRYLFGENLFIARKPLGGPEIDLGPAYTCAQPLLIHKVIHTAAP